MQDNITEDFIISENDENNNEKNDIDIASQKKILESFKKYDPQNKNYSTYLNYKDPSSCLYTPFTLYDLDKCCDNAQSDVYKVLQISNIVRKYINMDDVIGLVVDAITSNINTQLSYSYDNYDETIDDKKKLAKAKQIIKKFNRIVNIEDFIKKTILLSYIDGNSFSYLRQTKDNWTIMDLPLGVALVSPYNVNNDPVLMIDMLELVRRLRKTRIRTKKGKYLFYETIEDEIKYTYPKEVYEAYKNKERFAKLEIKNTGAIRNNNLGRDYGISSICKALKPSLMLDTFYKSDDVNAKSKAKKIIHQCLNKEIMGEDYKKPRLNDMTYAHENFLDAFKQDTVVVTTPPTVKSIEYVEPKTEDISTDKIILYRNSKLSSLGIGFLSTDAKTTASLAQISLEQLMKNINDIAEDVAKIIYKWYLVVLDYYGLNEDYCPTVTVLDCERMNYELKVTLAGFLYNTLSVSRDTAFNVLNLDVKDEARKRQEEKDLNYDEIFMPHPTAFNSNGNESIENTDNNNDNDITNTDENNNSKKNGRPTTQKDLDRKETDKDYNKNARVKTKK